MKKLFLLLTIVAFSFSSCSPGGSSPDPNPNSSTTGNNGHSDTEGNPSALTDGYTDDTKHDNSNPIGTIPETAFRVIPQISAGVRCNIPLTRSYRAHSNGITTGSLMTMEATITAICVRLPTVAATRNRNFKRST